MDRETIIKTLENIFDAYKVGESSISSRRSLIIEHIANVIENEQEAAFDRGINAATDCC